MLRDLMEQQKEIEVQRGLKNDPPGSPVGPYGHGQNGLFNIRGTNDEIFSAMMLPVAGALANIPVYKRDPAALDQTGNGQFSGVDADIDTILTGVTAGGLDDFDNQPTGDCADGPEGGLMKLCSILNPMSRFRASTREVSMVRAGRRADRLDPVTLRLMNFPVMQEFLGAPNNVPSMSNAIANEVARRMVESAVSFARMIAPRVWIGSPANNSGERKDLVGLNTHINAGNKIDMTSMAVCTAANSDVKNFGYNKVGGPNKDIVRYIEMCDRYVSWNAVQMGLGPFTGKIFMRPEMWWEITEVWPIRQFQFALVQMAQFAGGSVSVDGMSAQRMRNEFRDQKVLPVNGKLIPVVEDDTMPFETPHNVESLIPGQYASSIVFVPMTVMGGIPVTYFTYGDHNNENELTIQRLAGGDLTFTTDDGLYRWYVNFKNGCLKLNWETSPKLKCRTPMLGWRIDNVVAEPLQALRSWDPDSDYFANGGVTEQPAQKYYTSWSPDTPVAL